MTSDQFWTHVDRSTGPEGCWPWTGGRDANGYGMVRWHGKRIRAHRVALELDGRPVGPGLVGRHLCAGPKCCCNPLHLAPGTRSDDVQDCLRLGRHRHGQQSRLLTLNQAIEVRWLYRRGLATSPELARLYGIPAARVRHLATDAPYRG